jgi:hypothetical protein
MLGSWRTGTVLYQPTQNCRLQPHCELLFNYVSADLNDLSNRREVAMQG